MRWLFLGFLVLAVASGVEGVHSFHSAPSVGPSNFQAWFEVIIGLFFGTLAVAMILALGPGATRCEWSRERFALIYRSGRQRIFAWNEPRFHLRVVKYADKNGRTTYEINQGIPIHNPIPPELYTAILAEAARRDLSLRTQVTTLWSGQMVATDITHPPGRVSPLSPQRGSSPSLRSGSPPR